MSTLVTGATGKLGKSICSHLVSKGYELAISSRNLKALDELKQSIDKKSSKVEGFQCDLQDTLAVKDIANKLQKRGINITHIVNNARSKDTLKVGKNGTTDPEDFAGEFYYDVIVPYLITMQMASNGFHDLKSVVNISSMYGAVAPNKNLYNNFKTESPIQYGVSKAGLNHLTKELAVRLSPKVRVNGIIFGGFAGRTDQEFVKRYSNLCPQGRMLNVQEAGGPVEFLLNDTLSSSMTGENIVADGGWSIW